MIRFRLHIFSRLISLTHLKMHKFDKSHPGPTFILYILSFLRSTGTDRFCATCGLCSVECWRLSQCQGWKLAFEVGHAFVFESISLSVFVSFVCICIQIHSCLYLCSAVWCLSLSRLVGGRRSRCQRFSRDYSNGGNTEQSHSVIYRPTCHIWRHIYKHMIVCREQSAFCTL